MDERAVCVQDTDGRVISFFLPEDQIKEDRIKVRVLAIDSCTAYVQLPVRSLEGPQFISVDQTGLLEKTNENFISR